MNERAIRVLEFDKIRTKLASYALSDSGKARCLDLLPSSDEAEVNERLDMTEETVVILTYIGSNPLLGFDDVAAELSLAEKGAVLSPAMLLKVAHLLKAARNAKASLVTERENTPKIRALAERLQPLRTLEEDINNTILSEEEIADSASPALADIRRHIRQTNEKIRERLNSMAHGGAYSKYLMESIVTVRDGRYVLPVKQECRQNVPGIVHDQSATGATVFIEPFAVIELGNALKEWNAKEREEIERILLELSSEVGDQSGMINQDAAILALLDFTFAKGMLARDMNAIRPKINNKGIINLTQVRHPLIAPDKVVPCSMWLGTDFTSLIITGPNTGGKTVTLKTVGLMTLMAQSGLHVPGNLGTELAVFDEVYADIGDEQSIEQSLSTFSSHMTNITSIMGHVTNRDLVLFDELGAGTDPVEGAALAQAILDELREKGIRCVSTTHYSELKVYALTTKGVENASVEFDVSTLRPTYRLSIGVPGKSNAFEISRKLGLDEHLIGKAQKLLKRDDIVFEDVIANAEYHRQIAERERALAEEARKETVRLRNEAEKMNREIEEKRDELMKKARDDARRIVEKARSESENVISELKKLKKNASIPDHAVNALRKGMDDQLDALSEGIPQRKVTVLTDKDLLKPGDKVEVIHLGTSATVLTKPDAKGDLQVQAGIMKMKVNLNQLTRSDTPKEKKVTTVRMHTDQANRNVSLSCDVRGMNLEEAIASVDVYLDEAVLAGLHEVTIVHGKGMGILRSGIQQHLKKHKHVRSFRLGVFGEGEDGVSIVTLA